MKFLLSTLAVLASTTSAFVPTLPTSSKTAVVRSHTTKPLMIGSLMDMLGGGAGPALISPDKALPGRKEPMPNIKGSRHYVLGNDLEKVPEGFKVAVVANGCLYVLHVYI